MINYKTWDVVLIDVVFSEGGGLKKRPALIISSENYHRTRQEVIIAAITSNIRRVLIGDTVIDEWKEAGLLYPSRVTGIIQTLKWDMIERKLGTLSKKDIQNVQKNLNKAIEFKQETHHLQGDSEPED